MPSKACSICKRLQTIPTEDWKLVSYVGDFVCSKECVMEWIRRQKLTPQTTRALSAAHERPKEVWPPFRSMYEAAFAKWLSACKLRWEYERWTLQLGDSKVYTPDFFLPRYGVFLETKGRWGVGQKKKMRVFREQYPEVPLLVIPWTVHQEFYNVYDEREKDS